MRNITSLLERFSRILDKDSVLKQGVSESIKQEIGIAIPASDIMLKNGVLELTAGSTVKNEIRLKEERLLASFREKGIVVSKIFYK